MFSRLFYLIYWTASFRSLALRMPHVEQDLPTLLEQDLPTLLEQDPPTLLEHMNSSPIFDLISDAHLYFPRLLLLLFDFVFYFLSRPDIF